MGLIRRGVLWGLLSSTSILIGMAVVATLFGMYPKKFTALLKMNQQWVGEPLAWLLGWVPIVGDHLEAFMVSNGGGVALLVGEIAFVAKLILVVLVIFARFLQPRFRRKRNRN